MRVGEVGIVEQLRAANVSLRVRAFSAGASVGGGDMVVLVRETQDLADVVCTLTVGGFTGSGGFRDDGHVDMVRGWCIVGMPARPDGEARAE